MPSDPLFAVSDAEPIDPFDPEALRAMAPDIVTADKVLISIAVRRPARTEFFRVHPEDAYTLDWHVLEREGESSREVYWVHPRLVSAAPTEIKAVRMFTCISKRGAVFLWPAKLPSPDSDAGRRWHESALVVADHAKSSWVKMVGNKAAGAYEMFKARGDFGDPQWPTATLGELLKLAFSGDRTIDRADHPVLQELNGEI